MLKAKQQGHKIQAISLDFKLLPFSFLSRFTFHVLRPRLLFPLKLR